MGAGFGCLILYFLILTMENNVNSTELLLKFYGSLNTLMAENIPKWSSELVPRL